MKCRLMLPKGKWGMEHVLLQPCNWRWLGRGKDLQSVWSLSIFDSRQKTSCWACGWKWRSNKSRILGVLWGCTDFMTVRSRSEVRPNPFYIIVGIFLDLRGLVLHSHHRFTHPANSHRSVGESLTIVHSGPWISKFRHERKSQSLLAALWSLLT